MVPIIQNAALLFGGVFAVLLLLLGAVLIGAGLFTLQRHRAAAGWPQSPAEIERSEVVAERHFEGALYYRPVIRYRYDASGGRFVGDKLATTGKLYPKEEAARRVTARYPAGTSCMVRYNPAEAVLERNLSGGLWLVLFGLLFWAPPVAVALAAGFSWRPIAAGLCLLTLLVVALLLRSGDILQRARSCGLKEAREKVESLGQETRA